MKCSGCGNDYDDSLNYCPNCGAPKAFTPAGSKRRPLLHVLLPVAAVAVVAIIVLVVVFVVLKSREPEGGPETGTRLTYAAAPLKGDVVTKEQLDRTAGMFEERLKGAGIEDSSVRRDGTGLVVEVPVGKAAQAREAVSRVGDVQFRIVEDSKPVAEAKGDPDWQVTPEDERSPDKTVVLEMKSGTGGKELLRFRLAPAAISGSPVATAKAVEKDDLTTIQFTLKPDSAIDFERLTGENKGKQVAIVLDYDVISAPRVSDTVRGGKGEISGKFTKEQADEIASVLQGGAYPVYLKFKSEESF